MAEIPFPGGAADQDVFFHEDKVCVYHKAINTWECRTMETGTAVGQPEAVTTRTVYTVPLTGVVDAEPPELPDLRTQYEVNWYLSYHVLENKKDIEHVIWVDEDPPPPERDQRHYSFWFNTAELALYVWNEEAWFPVSGLSSGGVSTETFTYTINRIQSIIDEVYLKNIDQDNRLDILEENIVELEEEIDALAPSNERGEWLFNPLGVASPGNYAFLDGSTQPTERFDGAATIYVSTRDADNKTHSFNNHEAGEYLQIFNKEGDGYGLYEITDIDDNSGGNNPFYAFTVDFVQSLVTAPKAENRGRFKFFTIAEGDPGAYVLKTGDEMSGDLKVDSDILATGKYLGGHYNGSTFNTFSASVEIIENSGMLKYGSRRCMFWNDNGGVLTYGNRSIFGWSEDNSTAFKPIKIYDTSLVVDDNHVIHKGYVDEQIAELLAKIEELEMNSGQSENYRFTNFKVGYPKYGPGYELWQQLVPNELLTSTRLWYPENQQNWQANNLYFYIVLPNEYKMNPTGGYLISGGSGNYTRDSDVVDLTLSNVESHPLEDINGTVSTTHTVWKAEQTPTEHTKGVAYPSLNQSATVKITFYGGSISKATS